MRGCIKIRHLFKDYYQILQVHYDASPDVIKAAYRKLCTLYHPDTSHNPNEDKRMLDINEAYSILSNPEKRTTYHKLWLQNRTDRSRQVHPASAFNASLSDISQRMYLTDFFMHFLQKTGKTLMPVSLLRTRNTLPLTNFLPGKMQ